MEGLNGQCLTKWTFSVEISSWMFTVLSVTSNRIKSWQTLFCTFHKKFHWAQHLASSFASNPNNHMLMVNCEQVQIMSCIHYKNGSFLLNRTTSAPVYIKLLIWKIIKDSIVFRFILNWIHRLY